LGGRAIQDVWIECAATDASSDSGDWGTTLRPYDHKIDAWRSTWIGLNHGVVMPFIARQIGDEIVLELIRSRRP